MLFMGVVEALVASTAITAIGGYFSSREQRKGFEAARNTIASGGPRAIALAKEFEENWGVPTIELSNFYGIAPEGFDRFEESIYETQAARLQKVFGSDMEMVAKRMEAQGLPSSFIAKSLAKLEEEKAFALNEAGLRATTLRYGLQAEEAARATQFERDVAMDPLRLWTARSGMARDIMALSLGQTQQLANLGAAQGAASANLIGNVAGSFSSVLGSYAGYKGAQANTATIADALGEGG